MWKTPQCPAHGIGLVNGSNISCHSISGSHMLWTERLQPSKISILKSDSQCLSIWRWGLLGTGHESGTLLNGISAFIRRGQSTNLPSLDCMRIQINSLQSGRGLSLEPSSADIWSRTPQSPELREISVHSLCHPAYDNELQWPNWLRHYSLRQN